MTIKQTPAISRRRFLALTGFAAGAWLAPHHLFAQEGGRRVTAEEAARLQRLITKARKEAATANITVQALRGNVSVLMDSGGNIAVLPGRDGKVLVDSGFAASRPKITDALTTITHDLLTSFFIKI